MPREDGSGHQRPRLIHKGHTLHVWNIDIKNDEGELISSVQVTNYVIAPQQK